MKKSKLQGYFFLGINNGEIDINCAGDANVLAAAFATIITSKDKEEAEIKSILATAIAIAAEELSLREKYNSKTAKKPVKTATKAVNKK
jgi:uncharacterized protein YueI